ncbi:MAG: type II/IV secretion system protein, partial [Rhodothermales bacterium]|nr:type II/IV secretion system protein [Rhodothermales bacterium]
LHTNDAPSAVSRLYKMGIEPFLIAYAINIVVAQRLVRNLCPECKLKDAEPKLEFLEHVGFDKKDFKNATLFKANEDSSCKVCKGTGYKGRRAIAETMLFTDKIRSIIMKADDLIDEETLRTAAIEDGMTTLPEAARTLVLRGETSVEEIIRVTGT